MCSGFTLGLFNDTESTVEIITYFVLKWGEGGTKFINTYKI